MRVKLGAIVALVAAMAVAGVALAASGPSDAGPSAVSHRGLATREASRLIAAIQIPGQLAPVAPEPESTSALVGLNRAIGPVMVQRSGSWSVPRSAAAVRAYLASHPPPGTRPARPGRLIFVATHDPEGVAAARLTLTVVSTGPRSSAVHADALVRWLVARSADERVPAGARELEIMRGPVRHAPSLVVRVTAPARIARLRALLNRLAVVQPGRVYHCPAQVPEVPVVSFVFRAGGPGSRVVAVATEEADVRSPSTACDALQLTVDGRRQTPLLGGYRLLRRASALLGRRLWTRPYAA